MAIRIPRGWERPDSAATPEALFWNRRKLVKTLAAGPILLAAPALLSDCEESAKISAAALEPDPSANLYPVKRNPRYTLDRPVTPENLATSYNNYYEFGSSKSIKAQAQALPPRSWTLTLDGLVEKPIQIAIDDLLARMPLDERLYCHRCVEAWSMDVPWSGFPLKALVELARPLSSARYLRFSSFENADVAPGQKTPWYPWPYTEGLTMAEATNELAYFATGAYGKALPKQNGAPLRLTLPWKYGFKSAKGIVRIGFTDKQPVTFWEALSAKEYGFWANVNPQVPHLHWSQATERVLGLNGRAPTRIYNGYGAYVAELYAGMKDQRLFV